MGTEACLRENTTEQQPTEGLSIGFKIGGSEGHYLSEADNLALCKWHREHVALLFFFFTSRIPIAVYEKQLS
jgi:hypothetical protein